MPVEQREGQRTLARSDLDDAIARSRVDGEHDFLDDAAFVQEVLAEVFLGIGGEPRCIA
jgi:hypothetical protein